MKGSEAGVRGIGIANGERAGDLQRGRAEGLDGPHAFGDEEAAPLARLPAPEVAS
jgi:hypothetical protein